MFTHLFGTRVTLIHRSVYSDLLFFVTSVVKLVCISCVIRLEKDLHQVGNNITAMNS